MGKHQPVSEMCFGKLEEVPSKKVGKTLKCKGKAKVFWLFKKDSFLKVRKALTCKREVRVFWLFKKVSL